MPIYFNNTSVKKINGSAIKRVRFKNNICFDDNPISNTFSITATSTYIVWNGTIQNDAVVSANNTIINWS